MLMFVKNELSILKELCHNTSSMFRLEDNCNVHVKFMRHKFLSMASFGHTFFFTVRLAVHELRSVMHLSEE